MKLTPFGEAVRILRMRNNLSLKAMAEAIGVSSAHLSSIEYGEKRLADKHIDAVLRFLTDKVGEDDLANLRAAAERSKDVVSTSALEPNARGLVAAFARRLQEGAAPTPEIIRWLNEQKDK